MGLTGEWFFELVCRYGFESMAFNALVLVFLALIFGALVGYILSRIKNENHNRTPISSQRII